MKKSATRSKNKLVLNRNKQIPLESLSVVNKFYYTKFFFFFAYTQGCSCTCL